MLNAGKNESGTQKRDEYGASGVERLRQIQSSFRAFRRSQRGHVGVGCDFQKRLSTGHYEESEKKKSVYPNGGSRNKQNCSGSADKQPDQNSSFVAQSLHQPTRGQSGK